MLTGKAAGDLRRPWMASSAVSCESRGGVVLPLPIHSRGGWPVRRLAPSFSFLCVEGVRVSQEWDEVLHEVRLMVKRLDAFEEDLRAAADGGELTEDQCAFVQVCTAMASYCSLRLLDLCAEVTSAKKAEEGDTQK
jgi:hypothetical protein